MNCLFADIAQTALLTQLIFNKIFWKREVFHYQKNLAEKIDTPLSVDFGMRIFKICFQWNLAKFLISPLYLHFPHEKSKSIFLKICPRFWHDFIICSSVFGFGRTSAGCIFACSCLAYLPYIADFTTQA